MTKGIFKLSGKGSGKRSGATGAMPTLPPVVPSSDCNEPGGMVIEVAASMDIRFESFPSKYPVAKEILVCFVASTGLRAPFFTNGKNIFPSLGSGI